MFAWVLAACSSTQVREAAVAEAPVAPAPTTAAQPPTRPAAPPISVLRIEPSADSELQGTLDGHTFRGTDELDAELAKIARPQPPRDRPARGDGERPPLTLRIEPQVGTTLVQFQRAVGVAEQTDVRIEFGRSTRWAQRRLEALAPEDRLHALIEIAQRGSTQPGAMTALLKALDDEDDRVVAEAVTTIGVVGVATPAVIARLRALAEDPREEIAARAAAALASLRAREPAAPAEPPASAGTTKAEAAIVMREIRVAWRRDRLPVGMIVVNEPVTVEIPDLRQVRFHLSRLDTATPPAASAIDLLVRRLTSADDPRDRVAAAFELGQRGRAAQEAVPSLVTALRADDELLVAEAATALGLIGVAAPTVLRRLEALSDDRRPRVAARAAAALRGIEARRAERQDRRPWGR